MGKTGKEAEQQEVTENNDSQETENEDEECNAELPESLKLLLGESNCDNDPENKDSKSTRSRLQVDTIGLNSSTLDLELHALRNLVFRDILHESYESINAENNTRKEEFSENKEKDEISVKTDVAVDKPIKDTWDLKEVVAEEEFDDAKESTEEMPRKVSRVDKFIKISQELNDAIPVFSSKIWHQRKRLRLKKAAETRALRSKVPEEKLKKYKPKRYDYTLEILCKNNLYDNILVSVNNLVSRHEKLYQKFLRKRPFFPPNYKKYSLEKGTRETLLKLKRIQKPIFKSSLDSNLKMRIVK